MMTRRGWCGNDPVALLGLARSHRRPGAPPRSPRLFRDVSRAKIPAEEFAVERLRMPRLTACFLALIALVAGGESRAADSWVEGQNYVRLTPEQRTNVAPGKIEVMEVFSYACPACNAFQPTMEGLKHTLPPNAQIVYLPAAFHAEEDWPMFQHAYFAAQALGIADKTHQGIFDAVWKSGELATADPVTHRLKSPQPSLEDAAKVYARLAGVKPADFVATAKSFTVDVKARAADSQIFAMQVPGTPCVVVNGRYRIIMESVPKPDQFIALVRFLVAKESGH
jgi:thiol:disulfide interchange protein DsbA